MSSGTALRPPSHPGNLASRLLSWYGERARDLPWRGADPYRVLVSEFMLQQTQVTTVLPYYRSFLDRFPTPEDLADATESQVRAVWSGLGYYRRARNLQEAARTMVRDHEGKLPTSLEGLRRLPGIGEYTAAALGSIVHGIPRAVLDGNSIRVLTRLTAFSDNVSRVSPRRKLQALGDRIISPSRPGDWNQAIMELGATVCTPRRPNCPACPWQRSCRGKGQPERYPVKNVAPDPVFVERAVGVLVRNRQVLLERRRDPRLLDGTWEFPGLDLNGQKNPARALGRHLTTRWKHPVTAGRELARVRHSITRRRITVRAFAVGGYRPRTRKGMRAWVRPPDLDRYPVSSMTVKLMRALEKAGELKGSNPT